MNAFKLESNSINNNNHKDRCHCCPNKTTPENELLPVIYYKETEILNLKQQIQHLHLEIGCLKQESDSKL